MRPFIKRILLPGILLLLLLYAGDYVRLRAGRNQFGSMYAVRLKNRKTEYFSDEPQTVSCVNSVLPQMGYAPCWYLIRHRVQTVDIDAGRPQPMINGP